MSEILPGVLAPLREERACICSSLLGVYPQSTYIFKHALTQVVTYDSLLARRRQELHHLIGGTLEEEFYGTHKPWTGMIRYGLGFSLNSKEMPMGPNPRVLYWGG